MWESSAGVRDKGEVTVINGGISIRGRPRHLAPIHYEDGPRDPHRARTTPHPLGASMQQVRAQFLSCKEFRKTTHLNYLAAPNFPASRFQTTFYETPKRSAPLSFGTATGENELYLRAIKSSLDGWNSNILGKRVGINFLWGQTVRRRARAPLSHGGGCGEGGGGGRGGAGSLGGAHIVSVYHSHVTKFSPHRETLLTSTEHVAFDITYTYEYLHNCRVSRLLRKLIADTFEFQ
ncbi:jg19536 [Pararge aegeria aegeria]|uniref:Jg19536 protein n=1 Tax=Pararge aegeria aegeria TaxID=348720 RepID=A0A8S4R437_9NEOP|nr:jg19536 [Pararge aegeria aegeria]